MAGLGEACTHVGAMLFYLETSTKVNGGRTCTQQKCQWVIPSYQREIPYLPVKDLDFTSAKGKHKALEKPDDTGASLQEAKSNIIVPKPGTSDLQKFFSRLSDCGTKPAILSIIKPYSDSYIPKVTIPSFPKPLQELYNKKFLELSYTELLSACEKTEIALTAQNVTAVEMETRSQSKSNLWFTYRAGRITASRMKSVFRSDTAKPSQSLVKVICYPEAYKFSSKSTGWGCKHEKKARDFYKQQMVKYHNKFVVNDCGLFLNPKWPHLGASPDGKISCQCCSEGVVEIKCPYCHRHDNLEKSLCDKQFCLKKYDNGDVFLDREHAYYYQVQTQIFLCNVDYCDFVVCTFPEGQCEPNIHVERVHPDDKLWSDCVVKSLDFFKTCVLPEIMGKWYTRSHSVKASNSAPPELQASSSNLSDSNFPNDGNTPSSSNLSDDGNTCGVNTSTTVKTYCYCNEPEDESRDMIGCDNPSCSIEWFHIDCLKIKSIPSGKWYCPDCRLLPKFKRGKQ